MGTEGSEAKGGERYPENCVDVRLEPNGSIYLPDH
jgi:hypothetical protein